jgi:hypothetical protein
MVRSVSQNRMLRAGTRPAPAACTVRRGASSHLGQPPGDSTALERLGNRAPPRARARESGRLRAGRSTTPAASIRCPSGEERASVTKL